MSSCPRDLSPLSTALDVFMSRSRGILVDTSGDGAQMQKLAAELSWLGDGVIRAQRQSPVGATKSGIENLPNTAISHDFHFRVAVAQPLAGF
jgi:hypothetical protein